MAESAFPLMDSNDIVTSLIDRSAEELGKLLDGDVLSYKGPIIAGLERAIRDALEPRADKRSKLLFVLETEGGFLDVVVRIVQTLRHHYPDCIEFIVPNYAFSAGTVLVLSGDEIYMDYFSVLGPTDPQVLVDGQLIPALGYVERYEDLIAKDRDGELCTAEMHILISGFDQGRLQMYYHERELAKALLRDWLPKYKFKNWKVTETRQNPVDDSMRQKRAEEIADQLSDTKTWHSHGRGISREILSRDLKLKIADFGAKPDVNEKIRAYYGLLADFADRMQYPTFLHTPGRLVVPFRFQ